MAPAASDVPIILSPSGRPAREVFTTPAQPVAATSTPWFGWSDSSYFGAQSSDARSPFLLPTKWTEDTLRSPARTVLALKSRVLAENYGPGAALWNLSTLIGSLKVQAASGDPKWDAIAEAYWNKVTSSPLTFDAGGRLTLSTYQRMTTYRRMVDGDMFTVLTRSQSGHARVMGYEGLCVDTGPKQTAPEWMDGVRCDIRTRFPLAYNFLDRDAKGKQTNTILPAASVIHHTTQRTFAGRRGVPALAHAINDMHDTIETKSFQKHALKIAAMIGLTRAKAENDMGSPFNLPLHGALQSTPFQSQAASEPVTSLPVPKVKYEEAMESGLVSTVPFAVLHDERPHPNGEEFKKSLLRECAVGLGFPPQLLYFMDDPGGAYARIILEMAANAVIDHHVNHLAPMVRRLWAYAIAMGIKLGEVPAPQKGDWFKIRLTPPRMPTADQGRMGRLQIELRQHLQTNFARQYEELGADWEDELRQCAVEARFLFDLEEEYKLPKGFLTQALMPQQAAAAVLSPQPEPAPEPLPKAA